MVYWVLLKKLKIKEKSAKTVVNNQKNKTEKMNLFTKRNSQRKF